jgi:hypothetical protein
VLGAQTSPYLSPYEWQLSVNLRWLDSFRHFAGSAEQFEREHSKNNVVNRQRILDFSGTYALSRQCNITLSVPVLLHGSWSIPLPVRPPGPRYTQNAAGLGDIIVTSRWWLLDCTKHTRGNVSLGFGIKFPTGDPHVNSDFPNFNGQNIRPRPVDMSIQPGDGGWGFVLDVQGFQQVGNATLFASGIYLVNPRNVNGTPSILANLRDDVLTPEQEYRRYNSVSDQYVVRVGAGMPIKQVRGLTLTLVTRVEGVPSFDFIGHNDGFRRPGHSVFIEPGLIYTRGRHSWSISAPVAIERRRDPDARGTRGDATFADYFLLFGYTQVR